MPESSSQPSVLFVSKQKTYERKFRTETVTIDTTALRGNYCLSARSSYESIEFKHSPFSQPVCVLLNHKGMGGKDVVRHRMGLEQVKDFHQNQLFNENKWASCLMDWLDFVVKVSAFCRNIFLKKSNLEIYSENLEILYLGYAYNKLLIVFKFILKIILIISAPSKALAGININFYLWLWLSAWSWASLLSSLCICKIRIWSLTLPEISETEAEYKSLWLVQKIPLTGDYFCLFLFQPWNGGSHFLPWSLCLSSLCFSQAPLSSAGWNKMRSRRWCLMFWYGPNAASPPDSVLMIFRG